MIDYFIQATKLLLGESFFIDFEWSSAFLDICVFVYAIIIILCAFKLFNWLLFKSWR